MYDEAWQIIMPDNGCDWPDFDPPVTWDEFIAKGDFPLAASEKGLDLSADTPEAPGDRALTTCVDIDNGTVYLIRDPDEKHLFFIRYVSADGKTEEFHFEDNHWSGSL